MQPPSPLLDLDTWIQIGTLLLIVTTIFNYVAIQPLHNILKSLDESVHTLNQEMKENREDRRIMATNLSALNEQVKSAHKRIDEINDHCKRVHYER